MFSYVSGDKHIEIKTPTHQISTKSHGAHEKNLMTKCSSVRGEKNDVVCRGGVFGGTTGLLRHRKSVFKKKEGVTERTGIT